MKTQLRNVLGRQLARTVRALSTPDRHRLKIARDTMRMSCVSARIMGGPDHIDAANTIYELSRVIVAIDADCTCGK